MVTFIILLYLVNTTIVKYFVNIFENNLTKNSLKSVDFFLVGVIFDDTYNDNFNNLRNL